MTSQMYFQNNGLQFPERSNFELEISHQFHGTVVYY